MTTYAAKIEEANDNSVRKARVNAVFEGTGMAATGGHTPAQTATEDGAQVLAFPHGGDEPPQAVMA
jgi:hypothetical protein